MPTSHTFLRENMFVFEKICLEIQVCFSGQMNVRIITELLKNTPVLLKFLE